MSQIRVSIDVLNNYANLLINNEENIKKSVEEIKKINSELKQCWNGNRSDFFHERLDHCDEMSINELLRLCKEISDFIRVVSDAYSQTEASLYNAVFGE